MKREKSENPFKIVKGGKKDKEVTEKEVISADDEDAYKPKRGLKAPPELEVDGAKVWLKAATKLTQAGYSVDEFAESLLVMSYSWQKFVKKIKAGRDLRTAEVKAINLLLHEYGLSPTWKRGRSITEPQRRRTKKERSKMEQFKERMERMEQDDD